MYCTALDAAASPGDSTTASGPKIPPPEAVFRDQLEISESTWYQDGRTLHICGIVTNVGDKPASDAQLSIVVRDGSGRLVATDVVYADSPMIGPRLRSTFHTSIMLPPKTHAASVEFIDAWTE